MNNESTKRIFKRITRKTVLIFLFIMILFSIIPALASGTKTLGFYKDGIDITITMPDTFYSKKMTSGNWAYLDTDSDIVMGVRQDTIVSDYDSMIYLVCEMNKSDTYFEFTSEQGIKMILTLEESNTRTTATYYFISNKRLGYIIFVYGTTKAKNISLDIINTLKIHTVQTGWVKNSDGTWSYRDKNGDAIVGPINDGGTWYCFNEQGKMITGWAQVEGKWYYAKSSGELYNGGWMQVGATWYYFRDNGEMATGWVNDWGTYYYMRSDGTMATGWIEDHGDWYYMSPKTGALYTGWLKEGNAWYLLKPSGALAMDCWYNEGGTWYYFKGSGAMATDWVEIDGQWEMFDKNGIWQYTWDGK